MIDRRAFLAAAPLTALAAGCLGRAEDGADAGQGDGSAGGSPGGRAERPRWAHSLERAGVQLYTLRDVIAEDLDGALAALAAIGYREVELFQLHGLTAPEMRRRLDGHGLHAVSSHYDVRLLREALDATIAGASELDQHLMIVPSLPDSERTADGLARVADDFNRIGEAVRGAGMRFGYHNHDWEFRPLDDGTLPMDILLDRTESDLVDWQMDIFWVVEGGGDPLAELGRRGTRVTSAHVKDRTADGRMVDVGDGVIDFASVLSTAEERGLRHAFVEHDNPGDPMDSVRRSFEHLRAAAIIG